MSPAIVPVTIPRSLAAIAARPPALFLPAPEAAERFFEFFTANIRNKNTRRAYYKAACRFSDWCDGKGLLDLAKVKPVHVAAYIEGLLQELARPSVKQHLAALIPVGPVLALNTLRWADEVRDYGELKLPSEDPKKAGVNARELDMAKKLIDDMSDSWDPSSYHDTFRDDIMALVDRKVRAGKTEEVTDVETPKESRQSAEILDLSDLLKRSLGRGKGKTRGRSSAVQDDYAEEAAEPPRRKTGTTRRAASTGARTAASRKEASPRKRSAA